ncbi:hypothetical protein J6590_002770 [Homalodisca vitripennis]|nr:hypothetical protein J6590_002770 [Homalodisca vitripennis]
MGKIFFSIANLSRDFSTGRKSWPSMDATKEVQSRESICTEAGATTEAVTLDNILRGFVHSQLSYTSTHLRYSWPPRDMWSVSPFLPLPFQAVSGINYIFHYTSLMTSLLRQAIFNKTMESLLIQAQPPFTSEKGNGSSQY